MSKPDKNLYSFNGPEWNGQTVDWSDRDIVPDESIADVLKCSTGLSDFELRVGIVRSGYEDCLDVNNRCRNIKVTAKLWVLGGRMGITIKGDSDNVYVEGPMTGKSREVDVDLGNASDQSHDNTSGTVLNLWRVDGKPVTVRVLSADLPTEVPGSGPYKYVFPWKWKPLRVITVKVFLEWRRLVRRFKR